MLLLTMLAGTPAQAQVPLLVGSVRDQHGAAIAGAVITGRTAGGSKISASTDRTGTFVIHSGEVVSVSIACRFCQGVGVAVTPGQPIVAIVRRYDALTDDSPSPSDLENLPYAHIESSLALRPFTLLSQSSMPYPGSTLSDRGLSPEGSLLVDDGVPDYDITAGASPYSFIPAYYEQSTTLYSAANAYAYGDQAAGGVAQVDPFISGSNAQAAVAGSDVIARSQVGSDSSALALDSFSNDEESRQRTDGFIDLPLGADQSLAISGGTEQGRDYESTASLFAGSFSFAQAAFSDPRALNLSISTLTDRGGYVFDSGEYPTDVGWSDSGFSAGIHTDGPVIGFLDAGTRTSSGYYALPISPYGPSRLGAALDQTRADAGVETTQNDYAITAAVGTFWFDYAGGTNGLSQPAKTALAVPSLQAQIFPNGKWSLNLEDSGSFTLPTFVEQYLYSGNTPAPVALARNALEAAALNYTDLARIRITFEAASENASGSASGRISSAGLSAAWQIAPALSLRAWTMHVTDTIASYGTPLPTGGIEPTVNAFWLTYDSGSALRADAIYRRDLLDGVPFYHVDGAISGPLVESIRWYAGAEDRLRRTFLDAGLRFFGR